uniref:Ryncolin n=1 Tax=Hadrurus spadix TaxID=141984 RepID=A0A1W7R9L4_9SCOR
MKVAVYLTLSLFYFSIGYAHPIDSNISSMVNFLRYLDGIIHEVLALLNLPRSTHPGPIDCSEILKGGSTKSGIYRIWPLNWQTIGSLRVYCDMETDGGGWTIIQKRGDYNQPLDYFYKTWKEYKAGFGKLDQDFWLGNDKIYGITNQGNYTLRIDMKDKEGEKKYATYREFWIENESQDYRLHVSGYSGDAGDSFTGLNGMKFTTKDVDNDIWEKNCAESFKGGWWYSKCHSSNLNGLYHNGYHESYADGVNWKAWRGHNYSLPIVDMKIRQH